MYGLQKNKKQPKQCIVKIFCSWFSCCFTHTFAHFLAKHTFEISTTNQHCAHFDNDGLGFYLGKTLLTTKAPGGRLLCHADSLWCRTSSSLGANPSLIFEYVSIQVRCNFIYSCSFPQHHFSQLGFPHRSRSTLTQAHKLSNGRRKRG